MAIIALAAGLALGAGATWLYRYVPRWLLNDVGDRNANPPASGGGVRGIAIVILAMGLSCICFLHFAAPWKAAAAAAFAATLLALAAIDLETQLLPDVLTQPLLWAGLLLNTQGWFASPSQAVYGAAAGYLSLWVPFQVHRALTGRDGMGHGDFKLAAAVGAWLGADGVPSVYLLSVGAATAVSLIRFAIGDSRARDPQPFGPYLVIAALLTLVCPFSPLDLVP
ncbi:prepilin peptidase [Achromobacter sp. DMS1]|uniref:prepilin peptidase n=1 Tax=Achromobacter sp. DMS1 TaxID=1688405 RepID=UPI000A5DFFAF|nr:A24 family peptidase [Achromobacter sp. DMS1]